jgi:hypothetical protein
MLQPRGSWLTLRLSNGVFWGASRCEGCATGCWRWSPAARPRWLRRPWRSPPASMSVATAKWFAPAISVARAPIAGACRPSPAGCAASFLPAVSSMAHNASASACAAPGAAEAERAQPIPARHAQRDTLLIVATVLPAVPREDPPTVVFSRGARPLVATSGRIASIWARRSRGILVLSTDLDAGIAMEPWAFMGIGHNGARKTRAARRRSVPCRARKSPSLHSCAPSWRLPRAVAKNMCH